MYSEKRALLEVSVATFFLGTNAVLVKLVSFDSGVILFFRGLFTFVVLAFVVSIWHEGFKLKSRREYFDMTLLGLFMALNWIFFYTSIRISTVAVAMVSLFTFPIMLTFIEPYFEKTKIDRLDVILALITLFGVALMVPEYDVNNNVFLGVLLGLAAAFCYAFRNIVARKCIKSYSGELLMAYQALIVAICMVPFLFFSDGGVYFVGYDWVYMLFIVLFGTVIGHTLFVRSLKSLKARVASIITTGQLVVAVVCAVFVLNEIPSWQEIIGGTIVMVVVTYEAYRHASKDVQLAAE